MICAPTLLLALGANQTVRLTRAPGGAPLAALCKRRDGGVRRVQAHVMPSSSLVGSPFSFHGLGDSLQQRLDALRVSFILFRTRHGPSHEAVENKHYSEKHKHWQPCEKESEPSSLRLSIVI